MDYRQLGRTGLKVGVIGLGCEYLAKEPQEIVTRVVREALDNGANYFDLFYGMAAEREKYATALRDRRHEALIAGHLGAAEQDGQYLRTRDKEISDKYFHDLLRRLNTDYIDVLMLHYVDDPADLEVVLAPGGPLEQAIKYKEQGKVRHIGMSVHRVPAAVRAIQTGQVEVVMFPVNPGFDSIPGEAGLDKDEPVWENTDHMTRADFYRYCAWQGIGLVAMKPFGAGWLLDPNNGLPAHLTPVQCLSYTLSRPAVATAVPGCKSLDEFRGVLRYLTANESERDFSVINTMADWNLAGRCQYCNHCLPCPAGIDIGLTNRFGDLAAQGVTEQMRADYLALAARAADCLECGACTERCPFGVDVISRMRQTAVYFG